LRGEVVSRLALDDIESPQPIEVYILDNRNTFRHFLTFYYPELPPRRAFFFAQGDRRVVYAYQGDRLVEDLRHEATHALLNQCVVDLPLWLDEGLAEYFESDPTRGVNEEHVAHLPRDVADGWRPDLARLEAMADVRAMTPRDYREAWAWVHFLLESSESTRHDLLDYLAELRAGGDPEPMSRRLDERGLAAAHELLSHVTRLTSPELAARAQDARSIVRMQSGREVTRRIVPEPSSPRLEPMQRQMKGLFGPIARAFDWLDLRTARNRGRR
jgi:hypothetical protein